MEGTAIFIAILGVAAIIFGWLPTVKFFPGGFGVVDRKRPLPKWLGRLWFTFWGLWAIYTGLKGGTPLLVEKTVAVGIGVAIIISSMTERKFYFGSSELGERLSASKWFGRAFSLAIGLGFVLVGLALKR